MTVLRFSLLLLFFTFDLNAQSRELRPFETDYCTGYAEGTFSHPHLWKECCIEHDLYLWAGGSKKDRLEADRRLYRCVETTGAPNHARLIYWAVRAGSRSPVKLENQKWGNGWSQERKVYPLSLRETKLIHQELSKGHPEVSALLFENFIRELYMRLENP